MFRPSSETTLLGKIPFRLIVAVLVILAVVVSVLLLFSLEHEKVLVQALSGGQEVSAGPFFDAAPGRSNLIVVSVLLFLVSAIGIGAVITFVLHASTRRSLEEVKGLARNILESIPTGVLTVNRAGSITAVNPSMIAILRRSTNAVLGRPYDAVFTGGDSLRTVLDNALRHGRHVDHQDVPYQGREPAGMIRVTTVDLTGDDQDPAGVMLLVKDVTELRALERRVRVAEKLSALHTLSAGVAHELRNPLSAVDLNLHLLEEELRERGPVPPKVAQYVQVLRAESRRLGAILDNFLTFARPASIRLHEVDAKSLLSHLVSLLQYEADERKVKLLIQVADEVPRILGDETQVSQVLVNLVVNAFQAMPDGGTCDITAGGVRTDQREWLQISVRDSGAGINQEHMERLFEPFYTTKSGGSGLGLAVAYRIVHDHGGTIQVRSMPGCGTTVVVTFPAAAAAAREASLCP